MVIKVLERKRILLGVTGSIACYKSVDLASKLTQAGALVDTIMTESARRFVSQLSFRSVTGRQAYHDMWASDDHVTHVQLGEKSDLFIVAPATANTIAKIAHGLADNLLTVTVLAARCPVLIAPAMDGAMFEDQATQSNLATLRERGFSIIGPATGRMASGLMGPGRLLEVSELFGHIRQAIGSFGTLTGRHIVISAGPTEEPLDPVRFLSNRSTGKQGYALAQAAVDAGARVTLISGPVRQNKPVGVKFIFTRTAVEMHDAVLAEMGNADALIMAAAVSDFRPAERQVQKIKKMADPARGLEVKLTRNPDILAAVRDQKKQIERPTLTLGFAAETTNVNNYGREKLESKGLDFIAINDVTAVDAGFGVDTNRVLLLGADGSKKELSLQSKASIAEEIMRVVSETLSKFSEQQ